MDLELELEMVLEMASECFDIVSGMDFKWEFEMPSGMPSDGGLIEHICLKEIRNVQLALLHLSLLLVVRNEYDSHPREVLR
jgi:hypothetical protein